MQGAGVKWLVVALAAAVVALGGCSEEPTGPTTEDFASERKAVKERIAKRRDQQKKKQKSKVAAVSGNPTGPSFASVVRDYAYDSKGKRDPFRNFKWERPDRLAAQMIEGPLEQFDLSQLSLVAVVWKTGNARALIQDPSGASYIVAEGAKIGKNAGFVTEIFDGSVVVKETYVDYLGHETTKDIEMRLRRNEGG
jgi:Tfp pilus assembly protein PilP